MFIVAHDTYIDSQLAGVFRQVGTKIAELLREHAVVEERTLLSERLLKEN